MTEIKLILVLPAILCILVGVVLVTAETLSRREDYKRARKRAARRAKMF